MQETILLCGEGPGDYGAKEFGTDRWQEGAVQPIARKTAGKPLTFDNIEKSEIKKMRIQRAGVSGHAAKAYKLSLIARKRGMNRVICYVDADRIPGKGKRETIALESFRRVYRSIQKGFAAFNKKFNFHKKEIKGIPMVPLSMIECWLMSDPEAFNKCFGETPSEPRLPAKPELVWGDKRDSDSNYPKNLMKRVLNQYHDKEINRETYREIAENIDINVLKKKCPISFRPFHQDIARLET